MHIKIIDFNVAKFLDNFNYDYHDGNNYCLNSQTGTITFRAPETFHNLAYGQSVDIWASGCILYTLLCGYQPFYSEKVSELISQIENGQITF